MGIRKFVSALVVGAISCGAFGDLAGVAVTGGRIAGETDRTLRSFKGIPFAAPPVGELRWRAPQAVVAWEGVRDCTNFGPKAPQTRYPEGSFYARPLGMTSEDCLYLNVWTDGVAGDDRPVMVWIHGGGLTRGAGDNAVYDGAALAREGIVLVTINYRLGAFGYLAHEELTRESMRGSSGNYGVLDQLAALEWVQENIEAFGGDRNRVTIFGESAGSWSVNYLQATPLSAGLIHGVIGESGGVFGLMPPLRYGAQGQESAEAMGAAFLETLGAADIDAARAKSAEEILAAFSTHRGASWRANVDGWVFPQDVYTIYAEGRQQDVPVIVGSNADEGTSLLGDRYPKSVAAYEGLVRNQYGELADEVLRAYPAQTDAEAGQAFLALFRDRAFTWQMRTWARKMEGVNSKAYLYYFTHVPSRPDKETWGAYHAAEIIYAFRNLYATPYPNLKEDYRVSEMVSRYWINFATTGDPNGAGLPEWPAYDRASESYMELGGGGVAGRDLLKAECDVLEKAFVAARGE